MEAVGDLRAKAIHVVVVAVDAHDARAIDRGVEHLGGLEVRRNEDASVETLLCGLRGDGVGEIAGGRAADGGEIEAARGGESCGDDAVLEGEGRKAPGVIFEIEILQAPARAELMRGDQRRAGDGVWTGGCIGYGVMPGIEPHA